jgi:general secretion pathway protein B
MSYILDALRRSEQERRQADISGGLATVDQTARNGRRWLPWVLGAALSANAAVLAWLLLPARTPPVASPAPAAATMPATPASAPAPLPALADVAGRPNALPAAPIPAPTVTGKRPAAVRAELSPAEPLAATATPAAVQHAAVAPVREADAPPLSTMPADFRQAVPAIGVSVHVYAQQPTARWVLIDGRRVQEGQDAATGVRLERITPNGMVLVFRGESFFLRVR